MSYQLPPISTLPGLSAAEQATALGHLFEPCQTLTDFIIDRILTSNSLFSSYKQLIEAVRVELLLFLDSAAKTSPIDPRISKIIAAHPRLGGSSKAPTEHLSDHSSKEQKSLAASSQEEAQKLVYLNDLYESTFPGLRYVVFVNGRSREVVMTNMKERIQRNDIQKEREEAFEAMCDIALDRASKLTQISSSLWNNISLFIEALPIWRRPLNPSISDVVCVIHPHVDVVSTLSWGRVR